MGKVKQIVLFCFVVILAQAQFGLGVFGNTDSCCDTNQIQVTGEGRASGQPDVAYIRIRLSEQRKTSPAAVKALGQKVNQVLTLLKANGYGNDAYETESLYVNPQYRYVDGNSEIIGQTASQSLKVTVRGLDEKGQKVAKLVDALAQVNGINIDSVSFDIFDKSPLQTKARADAFNNAKAKAEDYAGFAGLSLSRLLTVNDYQITERPPIYANAQLKMSAFGGAASTSVPVGEQ